MQIVFNSSGTHVHKDALKVRLDLYPSETDKSYSQNYIYVPVIPETGYPGKVDKEGNPINQEDYKKWLDSLPHIWKLNPCLSVFVKVDENITKELLTQYIGDIYKPDVLATLDNALVASTKEQPHLSAHLISPYMRNKITLSKAKTQSFDSQSKAYIDTILKDFSTIKSASGLFERIQPQSVDIGPGALTGSVSLAGYTILSDNNPANADGSLDTLEVWYKTNATGAKLGTFYGSGTSYTRRDYELIGDVTSGSKQTFTGLACDVVSGDFIGVYSSTGAVIYRAITGSYAYYKSGDQFNAGTQTYGRDTNYSPSLYGTGTESGGGTTYPIYHKIGSGIRTGIGSGIA